MLGRWTNQVVYKASGLLSVTIFQASGTTDGIMLPPTTEDDAAYHPPLQSVCPSVTPTILSGLSSTHTRFLYPTNHVDVMLNQLALH